MKIPRPANYLLATTMGAALLAACSSNSGSSLAPSGSTSMSGFGHVGRTATYHGLLLTAEHPNLSGMRGGGPVSPDRHHKKKKPDQYISDFSNSEVFQFDYPKGDSSIGDITGVEDAQGECNKKLYGVGKGVFWVTASGAEAIDEFKVGGTAPIKTLTTSAGEPVGCAYDPSSNTLAATIINNGEVVFYANATGSGTVSQSPLIEAFFATYDPSGNLYVDGFNSNDEFGLVELKKGSSTWETLSTSNTVEFPGQVQYDGTYVTVNDQDAHDIFGYTCSGTTCTLKQTVSLSGSSDCDQTWIAKGYVVCPDAGNDDGEIYKYPAGGSAIATLTASFSLPLAASVEVK
jgi:hypothetical protein